MAVSDQILALEGELANVEQGSKEWKEDMQLLSKMYEIKNAEKQLESDRSDKTEEIKAENKRFIGGIIKDVAICIIGGLIAGGFQLLYIDEISNFEKDDTYTGRKKDFLPKGRSIR